MNALVPDGPEALKSELQRPPCQFHSSYVTAFLMAVLLRCLRAIIVTTQTANTRNTAPMCPPRNLACLDLGSSRRNALHACCAYLWYELLHTQSTATLCPAMRS